MTATYQVVARGLREWLHNVSGYLCREIVVLARVQQAGESTHWAVVTPLLYALLLLLHKPIVVHSHLPVRGRALCSRHGVILSGCSNVVFV
jgi:hypothetical protein